MMAPCLAADRGGQSSRQRWQPGPLSPVRKGVWEVDMEDVASHRRKHCLDRDIDHRGRRFHGLLGEQAIKAHAARKLSEGEAG